MYANQQRFIYIRIVSSRMNWVSAHWSRHCEQLARLEKTPWKWGAKCTTKLLAKMFKKVGYNTMQAHIRKGLPKKVTDFGGIFAGFWWQTLGAVTECIYYVSCRLCGQTKEHAVVMMSCTEECNNTHRHTHTYAITQSKTMVIVQLRFPMNSRQKRPYRRNDMHACSSHSTYYMHTIFTDHHKIAWSLFIVKPRITWCWLPWHQTNNNNNSKMGEKNQMSENRNAPTTELKLQSFT